jgi:hypothetical protein
MVHKRIVAFPIRNARIYTRVRSLKRPKGAMMPAEVQLKAVCDPIKDGTE